MALQISKEIRAGDILVVLGAIGSVFAAWNSVSSDIGLIKQSQAAQAGQLRDLKEDQKEQGRTITRIEEKVNRARL